MKIKYYKVTEDDILKWWFSLKPRDCSLQYNPLKIINDVKTGKKEWYYQGVPLKLKAYGRHTPNEMDVKIKLYAGTI